jgi:hypothetical protein
LVAIAVGCGLFSDGFALPAILVIGRRDSFGIRIGVGDDVAVPADKAAVVTAVLISQAPRRKVITYMVLHTAALFWSACADYSGAQK